MHTPSSLYNNYGGGDDVWDRFISSVEQLPEDSSVLEINDYLFLDGYRKVGRRVDNQPGTASIKALTYNSSKPSLHTKSTLGCSFTHLSDWP